MNPNPSQTSANANPTKTDSTRHFSVLVMALIIAGVIIVATVLIGAFVVSTRNNSIDQDLIIDNEPLPTEIIKIPFDYTVVSISDAVIMLEGKNGGFELPNDANITVVYRVDDNSLASINDLQTGQTVSLRIIPGEKAWIGIE